MIYYFSATGNSRHVAHSLAEITGDKCYDIAEGHPDTVDTLVIVSPVYSWGLPLPVVEWIDRLSATPNYCAGVLTCGDDTGHAPAMMRKALARRGVAMNACWSVQMPNTYVILPGFDVDPPELEARKRSAASARIAAIAGGIIRRINITDVVEGSFPRLKTAVVYPLFRRWSISPARFHTNDKCIGCGQCASHCPRHNITMTNSRPVWGKDCVSCLACYHHCPHHALHYGKITMKKGQYKY